MDKVFIGKILKPKGLDGTLKITNFTLGELAPSFKSVFIDGNCYHVLRAYNANEFVYIKTQEISSIDEAEKFRDKEIFGLRNELGLNENQFLNSDLIGLDVITDGKVFGKVQSIENFGATDILVISERGREVQVPMINGLIEKVDLENEKIILNKKLFDEVRVWE